MGGARLYVVTHSYLHADCNLCIYANGSLLFSAPVIIQCIVVFLLDMKPYIYVMIGFSESIGGPHRAPQDNDKSCSRHGEMIEETAG